MTILTFIIGFFAVIGFACTMGFLTFVILDKLGYIDQLLNKRI
jgi:hypothetical protein